MKTLSFVKYHGTGNDFIMIHDPDKSINLSHSIIREMCERRFGIGSDGLILIQPSDSLNFHMEFFNPDASQSFCGNGSRCAVHFAHSLGIVEKSCTFSAIDGVHQATLQDDQVTVSMQDVEGIEEHDSDRWLHTGSPHYVRWMEEVAKMNVVAKGREIRYNSKYAEEGVNVNFVKRHNNHLEVRTYERGVEAETFSCGTGVTAVAIADHAVFGGEPTRRIQTKGGELKVSFRLDSSRYSDVKLEGPATPVFQGTYAYSDS